MTREELGASLNLDVNLIPTANANRPETPITPQFITIHSTDNTDSGADANAHSRYLINSEGRPGPGRSPTSWHYTVDNQRIIKHLPLNEKGYHAYRSGNGVSVGIELCMNSDGNWNETKDRAARLVAALLYDFDWDTDNVVQHNHWPRNDGSRKDCPSRMRENDTWDEFVGTVGTIRDSIEESAEEGLTEANFEMGREFEAPDDPLDDDDIDHGSIEIPEEFLSGRD